MCTAFRKSSDDLCLSMALVARRICREDITDKSMAAFVACRLLALDKSPGVRPIGVGEVLRRILGKSILSVIGPDVEVAAGVNQLCAGQTAGCEVAVHARSRGAVVCAALLERKVAGSIPTIGDFHTVGPCKTAVFACLATDVK